MRKISAWINAMSFIKKIGYSRVLLHVAAFITTFKLWIQGIKFI